MADSNTTTGNNMTKRLHPDGMDREAALLAHYAEVPSVNKAWVQSLPGDGALITVSLLPYVSEDLSGHWHLKMSAMYQRNL